MAIKKFKPTTPGQRHKVIDVFRRTEAVKVDGKIVVRTSSANKPEKSLVRG